MAAVPDEGRRWDAPVCPPTNWCFGIALTCFEKMNESVTFGFWSISFFLFLVSSCGDAAGWHGGRWGVELRLLLLLGELWLPHPSFEEV